MKLLKFVGVLLVGMLLGHFRVAHHLVESLLVVPSMPWEALFALALSLTILSTAFFLFLYIPVERILRIENSKNKDEPIVFPLVSAKEQLQRRGAS